MGNISYRVYELRVMPPNGLFRFATGTLIGLLVLAAAAAALAARSGRTENSSGDKKVPAS
jgi:hypothetical protein